MTSENNNLESFFEFGKIRELKGLEYGGEENVKCCNCNKELFVVMRISDRPTVINLGAYGKVAVSSQYFVSNCPFCKDQSWKIKIDGQCMIRGSHGKTVMANISTDLFNGKEVINTIELMRDTSEDSGQ